MNTEEAVTQAEDVVSAEAAQITQDLHDLADRARTHLDVARRLTGAAEPARKLEAAIRTAVESLEGRKVRAPDPNNGEAVDEGHAAKVLEARKMEVA